MNIHVIETVCQIAQQQQTACLITNSGPGTVYLGTASYVTPSGASLTLLPRQSVNWQGGALWGICEPGAYAELMILPGGNTTVSPVTSVEIDQPVSIEGPVEVNGTVGIDGPVTVEGDVNVTGHVGIDGPVTVEGDVNINGTVPITGDVNVSGSVDINGGTINVDTISGNVNVDGSTVNIGNNVRLWGGGDYLGYVDVRITATGLTTVNLSSSIPAIITGKYNTARVTFEAMNLHPMAYLNAATRLYNVLTTVPGPSESGALVAFGNMVADSFPLGPPNQSDLANPITSTTISAELNVFKFVSSPGYIDVRLHLSGTYEQNPPPNRTPNNIRFANTPIISGWKMYIPLPFAEPMYIRLATGSGSTQAGRVDLVESSPALGSNAFVQALAANLSTPLQFNLYPTPGAFASILLDYNASNTGQVRVSASPLYR